MAKWDWSILGRPQSEVCLGLSGIEIKGGEWLFPNSLS